MIYEVTAVCVDNDGHILKTGVVNADAEGRIVEIIDTESNALFAACRGPWDVEDCYEAFWNRLNASWERNFPKDKERVKVLKLVQR